MECGVIADSGYFSVEYPHLSENFMQNIQRKLSSTPHSSLLTPHFSLSPNSIPVRQHKVEGVINSTLLTPHSSLHTPHCSDVCVFEVNVGDFVADRMIEEDFSNTAEIFYGITDIITAGTFL